MDQNIVTEIVEQAKAAFKALQEYGELKTRKFLFPENDASVFLAVKYKKIALIRGKSFRTFVSLPCSDRNASNTSICLILPDLDRSAKAARDPDVEKQAREWAQSLFEKYGLTGKHISKIFTITQLKREYTQNADKAKLAKTYDIFMVDKKLMKIALHFLGQSFKKPAKMPLPIDASVDVNRKLQEAYSLVQLNLAPLRDTISIRIGNLGQSLAEIESNLKVVVNSVLKHCPGGPTNIRSCHLQTSGTEISLPIFVDFGSANEVHLKVPKQRRYAVCSGECSTLPVGLLVKVRADGEVKVINEKTGREELHPTQKDEWERDDDISPLTGNLLEKQLRKMGQKRLRNGKAKVGKSSMDA